MQAPRHPARQQQQHQQQQHQHLGAAQQTQQAQPPRQMAVTAQHQTQAQAHRAAIQKVAQYQQVVTARKAAAAQAAQQQAVMHASLPPALQPGAVAHGEEGASAGVAGTASQQMLRPSNAGSVLQVSAIGGLAQMPQGSATQRTSAPRSRSASGKIQIAGPGRSAAVITVAPGAAMNGQGAMGGEAIGGAESNGAVGVQVRSIGLYECSQ